ncbi:type IV pilus modification protein PilV [Neisseria shayeganii]|uniref:type IV pilus modification protein PilV n=1 Tax=Neisseria shayeganii TaxID=607712 RepID=UPI0006810C3C|nr:type IV pilus modification protein PilV [Neisseria shayeganii]
MDKKKIRGATLLEVLVSVFIMAFGIMALMLAQLKSVGSVREAEMQTRVALAVQNLAEGMLSNPDVRTRTEDETKYTGYEKSGTLDLAGSINNSNKCNGVREAVINCHREKFEADLRRALPNARDVSYSIGKDGVINVRWEEVNDQDEFKFSYTLQVGS